MLQTVEKEPESLRLSQLLQAQTIMCIWEDKEMMSSQLATMEVVLAQIRLEVEEAVHPTSALLPDSPTTTAELWLLAEVEVDMTQSLVAMEVKWGLTVLQVVPVVAVMEELPLLEELLVMEGRELQEV